MELAPTYPQVLIRLASVGVNPVDTYIRSGRHTVRPALPYTPGNDGAGVVAEVGAGVTRVRPGDRVFGCSLSGSYAEYALGEERAVFPLPTALSFHQGAAIGVPYFTAYRALGAA